MTRGVRKNKKKKDHGPSRVRNNKDEWLDFTLDFVGDKSVEPGDLDRKEEVFPSLPHARGICPHVY